MNYTVEITDTAFAAIQAQTRYIAIECQAPLNASAWLQRVWDVIEGLEQFPARHGLAVESQFKPYEVRRAIIDHHFILFTIDESVHKVWVIGFRHGSQLPRPDDLLDSQPP